MPPRLKPTPTSTTTEQLQATTALDIERQDAADRFTRASYYVGRLPKPKSQVEAIASMFSVIRNAAQPFRISDPEKPYASQTIWRMVADLTNKHFVFESAPGDE